MYYYEVLVSSPRYHGETALTYSSSSILPEGSVIIVPLQKQEVLGVVSNKVAKPRFATKSINKVIAAKALPPNLLALIPWLKSYYPAPLGQILALFLPNSLRNVKADSLSYSSEDTNASQTTIQPLTSDQEAALTSIRNSKSDLTLLHGDTATGKTRVYIELAEEALQRGQSVIMLSPEIGLTSQLVEVFNQRFSGRVYLLHSNLSPLERSKAWLAIAQSKLPLIVIGPRSALFSPVKKLGLIVVDEFHDQAYKQEQSPYYQTTRVAAKLGEISEAKIVFGSATPPVSDYYAFESKNLPIIRMKNLATQNSAPRNLDLKLINLRDRSQFNKSSWLSDTLINALAETIKQKRQALLFLNRRGSARLIICQVCGWQALCPRCDLPLTYHSDEHGLRCHTCGYSQAAPSFCPTCKSTDIVFSGIGTKYLYSEVNRILPEARVLRFDRDSKKSERLEAKYRDIHKGDVDVLVGTQMLSKGLDLPKLGLVGVVIADTSLYFPDYTAEERTYQMITQVMGRIDRGHGPAQAIIQTYHPDNQVLNNAVSKKYEIFYKQQLGERKQFNFPPFIYALKLHCTRTSRNSAMRAAAQLAAKLKTIEPKIDVIGPSPAFIEKKLGRFSWQLIITAKRRSYLTDIIKELPSNWHYDIDPSHFL